ncbi:protein suppressor of gene silencing [Datura stramonium]|uniref:Protein suppressor of gene silencing n=1 Tax=Datura stramonium TaxID=4076 RepID=A0ABS8VRF8_DATST|nr:protein suppressor of gene silencing [Datura stramonium]
MEWLARGGSWVDETDVGVGDLCFKSDQNDGWVVCARKSKNKGGTSGGKKQWTPQNPISESRGNKISTWGHANVVQKLGLCNNVGSSNSPIFYDDFKVCKASREDNELDFPGDNIAGYMETLHLSKKFSEKGRDRDSWEHNPIHFYPGGIRKLYGYLAEKRDMENINKHSHGKSRLKFEMKLYAETTGNPSVQMSEDNQQLVYFKKQACKSLKKAKALEDTLTLVSEKHRQTVEENNIVRLKTMTHYEENKEDMVYQEQFFKDQFKKIYDDRIAKEDKFKKIQQEPLEMIKQSFANASLTVEDHRVGAEKISNIIKLHEKRYLKVFRIKGKSDKSL